MKIPKSITLFLLSGVFVFFIACETSKKEKPNILFICIDDLNDWTGFLGGHPGTKTPHLDDFAANSLVFEKAYCPAPACNPSRVAIMTGIRPSSSGVYTNHQPFRASTVLENKRTLPQYFRNHGYTVLGSGKTFHDRYPDPDSWDEYWPSKTQQRPKDPMPQVQPLNGIPKTGNFDWGPVQVPNQEMGDWQVTDWVISKLEEGFDKPFFLACGIYRPHLPWHAPEEYFDKFPIENIQLPEILENDTSDLPKAAVKFIKFNDHENVTKYNQWRQAIQGYLACINFADECVGRVLHALEQSEYKNNTIVVIWSDHGWHLGEKQHWRKFALWENTTRTVFMIKVPGSKANGKKCTSAVNLLDIYPTLTELCGIDRNPDVEGTSLIPLLEDPATDWASPSITTHFQNNHAVRLNNWRYIQYKNGDQELYDHNNDFEEWHNLILKPEYDSIQNMMKTYIPEVNLPPIPSDR